METMALSNGIKIPVPGYGTWQTPSSISEARDWILTGSTSDRQ